MTAIREELQRRREPVEKILHLFDALRHCRLAEIVAVSQLVRKLCLSIAQRKIICQRIHKTTPFPPNYTALSTITQAETATTRNKTPPTSTKEEGKTMNIIEEEIRRHEASIRWLQIISIINSITCLILAITRMLR
nr:MAG TPA: hypothetical protein [Caudoviricetes sp.]